jgi:Domain of unknown function (DUF4351)
MTQLPNDDYDNPWKTVIELYFREFMVFFFPEIAADIDWERGFVFMDKELQKVVRDGEVQKRYADKLIQLWRLNGDPLLVMCHIEVQGQKEDVFGKRMFSYNYRLRDRYDCPVASLAILADDSVTWRPRSYQDSIWGCNVLFEFPIVKLSDYRSDWAALEASENPFAIVVMAHLKTQETKHEPEERKTWKFRLTTMLYDRGYSEQAILDLYNFLDWMMRLPEDIEQAFQVELEEFEEARKMKYVTTIERMAEARGEARGGLLKTRSLISRQLVRRFGEVSPIVLEQVDHLSIAQLESLGEALFDFETIADLTAWLENPPA